MHLSPGYAWRLELSKRELAVVIRCLNGDDLSEEEDELAQKLANTITMIQEKKEQKKLQKSRQIETD